MSTPRVLVVVAHPDDESFGCGSVLAHAADRGAETVVCCATRGEAGECAPGFDLGPRSLAAVREEELHAASAVLGVGRVVLLDHLDSGMADDPPDGALVAVDPEALADEIRALIDEVRPDVVVTLDGSDGHRDHTAIRDATLAAVRTPGRHQPERAYLECLAQQNMARWADHQRRLDRYGDYTAAAVARHPRRPDHHGDRRAPPPRSALGCDPRPRLSDLAVRRAPRRPRGGVPRHRPPAARAPALDRRTRRDHPVHLSSRRAMRGESDICPLPSGDAAGRGVARRS